MGREYTRAVLRVSCDERLIAGVGGAVAYFAERAGLAERSRESLVAALEEFCLDALPAGARDPLDVAIEDFEDRIEIVVEQNAQQDAVAAQFASAGHGAIPAERAALRRLAQAVDRMERAAHNGSVRTTLVKFL